MATFHPLVVELIYNDDGSLQPVEIPEGYEFRCLLEDRPVVYLRLLYAKTDDSPAESAARLERLSHPHG